MEIKLWDVWESRYGLTFLVTDISVHCEKAEVMWMHGIFSRRWRCSVGREDLFVRKSHSMDVNPNDVVEPNPNMKHSLRGTYTVIGPAKEDHVYLNIQQGTEIRKISRLLLKPTEQELMSMIEYNDILDSLSSGDVVSDREGSNFTILNRAGEDFSLLLDHIKEPLILTELEVLETLKRFKNPQVERGRGKSRVEEYINRIR